ncbi:saccharopine dehydrogenase family protein [Micromonospora cathayae]|uniref:Saccharopine dehydrogenase NADP-binding domain-containing protein n=1 Tax=Micromonospora cathayae TaxID=3028804 RepID=A0ABY7ZM48_9ACTN|nr:saccharopine dehydrogenase family protein [Micromonospora sp. HUAS 3]WDZ83836.1 saccharopine dehydrogenase NADP-binding domain-containing protein [Micromonospora sp. HUAS 3]
MAERIPASGRVHWVGAGLSTGSGLGVLCDQADQVLLWHRTVERAEERLAALGLAGRATPRALDGDALADALEPGDVVVSMLPADHHPALLRLCLASGAHFACSSYVSEPIAAESAAAARHGIVVLAESGADPGIDHLFAHKLVAQARAELGDGPATVAFTSYCGGLPAVPNDFRYRFSWSPRAVLTALRAPGRYIEAGVERVVAHPWEATRPHLVAGESFEAYPNRDSVPFLRQYALPPHWRPETFIRGTLRLAGWRDAWAPVFETLRAGDPQQIGKLADDLGDRYPMTGDDRDRLVLAVTLDVHAAHGGTWSGQYLLDVVGDDRESAMARCVSLPLAFGVTGIITGRTPAGLHRAAEEIEEIDRWLDFLGRHGVVGSSRIGGTTRR